jgi:hypothetical protein
MAWRLVLAHVVNQAREIVSKLPSCQALLRPPLWPVNGNPLICAEPLFAREEILEHNLSLQKQSRDWIVAWGLLCQAEADLWGALLHELLPAPFYTPIFFPLLGIYASGFFPLGWECDAFYLYRYLP